MENDYRHTPESDLDKTDRLPVLAGTLVDRDVADDAVPLYQTEVLAAGLSPNSQPEPIRPTGVDLPSLAQNVRSLQARIVQQSGEFEALTRTYERARETESVLTQRAHALAVDLAAARTALESEQERSHELDRALAERKSAVEAARSRVEQALRDAERHQSEARMLRDSLGSREATIVQLMHSLAERDAQLSALQQEHAKVVPALEANSRSTSQLQADLQAARADASALGVEMTASRAKVATLTEQLKRSESEISAARYDLGAAKIQASNYLDLLRTRDWRQGFDQNLFRELDAKANAINAGQVAIEAERDRLRSQVTALESRLSTESAQAAAERNRLTAELAARERSLDEARQHVAGDAQGSAELRAAAGLKESQQATQHAVLRAEQAAQIKQLQSEAQTHQEEMAVLRGHLNEARQPAQSTADVKRLTDALAAKVAAVAHLEDQDRKLRAALERTRAELEEREFFIRRLELSESNNVNPLGRIQTSIERMGSIPVEPSANSTMTQAPEMSAELIKTDGAGPSTYVLSKRTRIGRAAGCELQIDSSSVSRHHALVVVGPHDTVIEDLNSTNGVYVNGRKVVRQLLADGDAVTIGESKFRYCTRPLQGTEEPRAAEPTPGE